MMKKMLLGASALALVAACGGATADEFAASTPDVRGQLIEITGSSAEGATFLTETSSAISQDLSNPPEYLAKTRATVKGLNDVVKKFLTPVTDMVDAGTVQGTKDAKVYGPKDDNGVTWMLTVKRGEGRRFAWRLDGKTVGAPDTAFTTVAAGKLTRTGVVEHRGSGVTSIDLDAYASIDPTSHAQGKLFNAFKHFGDDGAAKVVVYVLKGFSADSTLAKAADGVIYGHKTPSGEAVVRVAAVSESLAPATAGATDAGPELMLARLRWIPSVGGRADIVYPSTMPGGAVNGDVPAGKFVVARSCWDKAEQEGFKTVAVCDAAQPASCSTPTGFPQGTQSSCKAGVDHEDDMSQSDEDNVSAEHDAPGSLDDVPSGSMSETENERD